MAETDMMCSPRDTSNMTLLEKKRLQWEQEMSEIPSEEWFPFGRPGCGAPMRKTLPRVAASRRRTMRASLQPKPNNAASSSASQAVPSQYQSLAHAAVQVDSDVNLIQQNNNSSSATDLSQYGYIPVWFDPINRVLIPDTSRSFSDSSPQALPQALAARLLIPPVHNAASSQASSNHTPATISPTQLVPRERHGSVPPLSRTNEGDRTEQWSDMHATNEWVVNSPHNKAGPSMEQVMRPHILTPAGDADFPHFRHVANEENVAGRTSGEFGRLRAMEQSAVINRQLIEKQRRDELQRQWEDLEAAKADIERQRIETRREKENEQERQRWLKQYQREQSREANVIDAVIRAREEAKQLKKQRLRKHATPGRRSSMPSASSEYRERAPLPVHAKSTAAPPPPPSADATASQPSTGSVDSGTGSYASATNPLMLEEPSDAPGMYEQLRSDEVMRRSRSMPAASNRDQAVEDESTPRSSGPLSPDDRPIRPLQMDTVKLIEQLGYTTVDEPQTTNTDSSFARNQRRSKSMRTPSASSKRTVKSTTDSTMEIDALARQREAAQARRQSSDARSTTTYVVQKPTAATQQKPKKTAKRPTVADRLAGNASGANASRNASGALPNTSSNEQPPQKPNQSRLLSGSDQTHSPDSRKTTKQPPIHEYMHLPPLELDPPRPIKPSSAGAASVEYSHLPHVPDRRQLVSASAAESGDTPSRYRQRGPNAALLSPTGTSGRQQEILQQLNSLRKELKTRQVEIENVFKQSNP